MSNDVIVRFVPAVKTHTEQLASRLVDEAGRILSSDGAAALSLRKLAQATGTSTMAVYTLFGDKQGLLAAMYREGYLRLGAALREAASAADAAGDDPLNALVRLGYAYRASALANPHLYELMFGRPVPAFAPDELAKEVADATYQPLVETVRRCVEAGSLVGDPERIALHLWSVSHGTVSLELNGHLPDDPGARTLLYEEAMVFSSWPFLRQS
jgi:AcrR family transcriptional regulator